MKPVVGRALVAAGSQLVLGSSATVIAAVVTGAERGVSVGTMLSRLDVWLLLVVSAVIVASEAAAQVGDDSEVASRWDRWLAVATGLAVGCVLVGGPAIALLAKPASAVTLAVGASLALAGGAVRAASIRNLGASFVTDPGPARGLRQSSLHGLVRHPVGDGALPGVCRNDDREPELGGVIGLALGAGARRRTARSRRDGARASLRRRLSRLCPARAALRPGPAFRASLTRRPTRSREEAFPCSLPGSRA